MGHLRKYGNTIFVHRWQDAKYCLAVSWVKFGLLSSSKRLEAWSKKTLSFWRPTALFLVLPKVCCYQQNMFHEKKIKSSIVDKKEIVHQSCHTRSSRLSSWWKAAMTWLRWNLRRLLGRSMSNAIRVMNFGSDDSTTAPGKKRRGVILYHTKVSGSTSFTPITFSCQAHFHFIGIFKKKIILYLFWLHRRVCWAIPLPV